MKIVVPSLTTARISLRQVSHVSLFLIVSASDAVAVSIAYNGMNLSTPFETTYRPDTEPPIDLVLQIANDADTTISLLSWQLELQLRPVVGAEGTLLFESVTAPPNSLFGQNPGPQADLTSPNAILTVFDGDPHVQGRSIHAMEARNILETILIADSDAAGSFQVVMPEFNQENPDIGSSWFETDGIAPSPFENDVPSAFSGFVLLGTIMVVRPGDPEIPGDYNKDEVVDSADYDLWRAQFGNNVATHGNDADGNRNGIVDAADYVIWRKNLSAKNGLLDNMPTIVPEPSSFAVVVNLIAIGAMFRSCRWISSRPHVSLRFASSLYFDTP